MVGATFMTLAGSGLINQTPTSCRRRRPNAGGCSSVVERQLPKLNIVGSSPITRSIIILVLLSMCLLAGCATRGHITTLPPDIREQDTGVKKTGVYHRVKNGETLWRISQVYGVPINDIIKANRLPSSSVIEEGQLLYIPGRSESLTIPKKSALEAKGFIWPVKGRVISLFGAKWDGGKNKGIDIEAKEAQKVVASKSGKVIFCSDFLKGYGKTIIIDHGDGFSTVYAHNKEILVRPGDKVARGEAIAVVGSTGRTSLTHLHFEIRKGHEPQNPLYYLPR